MDHKGRADHESIADDAIQNVCYELILTHLRRDGCVYSRASPEIESNKDDPLFQGRGHLLPLKDVRERILGKETWRIFELDKQFPSV